MYKYEEKGIMNVKVSIILPSLNVAEYIKECLDSVIAQTLQEIEVLCVDAGSTDGTLEILQEYAKRDFRIQIIYSEVKSYGRQVNEGILKAKGKYIAIVDTDDFVAEEMYQKLYSLAEEYNLDYVKADYDAFIVSRNGGRVWHTNKTFPTGSGLYGKVIIPHCYSCVYKDDYNIWKGIYQKDFLVQFHIKLNESSGASFQDVGFILQTLCLARRAMYIEDSFYRYRMNREGASTNKIEVVQFIFQEFSRLLDEKVLPVGMDRQAWGNVYYRMAMCFSCEYDKVLRSVNYQTDSPYLSKYYEWFKQKIQRAVAEGLLKFSVFDQSYRLELQLLLKSTESYTDYKRIKDSIEKEPIDQLVNKIQNRPIVIFGCGKYGKKVCSALDMRGIDIVAFCDNNEKLWNTEYYGIKILEPAKCCGDNGDVVYLIASKYQSEDMKDQLKALGIAEEHIIS